MIELKDNLFNIGQVAAICRISIQTLRYYDSIGLLKPALIGTNNYRYYSTQDIILIRLIQDMKEMGFMLEEIKKLLKQEDLQLVIEALRKKKEEYDEKIFNMNAIVTKINNRLQNLEFIEEVKSDGNNRLNTYAFEESIELKSLPDRKVAFIRNRSDTSHTSLVLRYYELDSLVKQHSVPAMGFRMAVYHDFVSPDFNPADSDLEVCIEVNPDFETEFIRVIPGGLYATAIYQGAYQGQCHRLLEWVRQKKFAITGPGIEIYINSFMNTPFPKNYITEIQFPIIQD